MLARFLDPRRLEDPQKGKITVTVKVPESPGGSTIDGTQGVSATTHDSRMPIGTSSDHDNPSSASATSGNQGTSVAVKNDRDDTLEIDGKVDRADFEGSIMVAKTGDERKVVSSHAKKEKTSKKTRTGGRDSTSFGGSVVTHRDEIAPRSEVASTIIWSMCPMNISFMTEINSRDERILYTAMICVSALMLVLLTITLVLLAYARRTRSPLACVTAECQAAFDYLTRLVNASRDACSDFYGYVCDSWLERRKDGGSFRKDNIAAWLTLINDVPHARPMNISFMTEINSRDERILYTAMICVSALMLVLLTITLVLLAYARRTRSPLACVTAECQAAFDYLTRLVNASRDACSDFYGYVWHDGVGSAGVRVMRHVYGNCHHYVSTKSTSLSFEKTLASARQQLNWTQVRSARSYKDLVEHLVQAAILSGCHTIMRMEVFRDYHEVIVSLTRGESLLRKLTTTGDRQDLEKALEGVLKDDLDKIVEVDLAVDAELYSNRSAEWREEPEVTMPLREILQGIFPNVSVADWVQAFDHVLLSSGKHVYASHASFATGVPYFRRAFREMADNNGIEVTALYAASHLDAEVLSLQLAREQIPPDAKKAARFCLNLVQRAFAHSSPKLISKLIEVRGGGSVLKAMYQNIKQRSQDFDVLFLWLPKTARPVVEKKIDLMTLVVASEESGPDLFESSGESEDEDYSPLLTYIETQSAEFVDMYLRTKSYSHARQARSLPTVRQLYVSRFEGRHELAYTPILHALVVPKLYEMSPYLYTTGVPSQFNYATVGALMSASIAGMMAPAALPPRRAVSALQIIRPQHASAVKLYNVSTRCLQRLHSRLGLQSDVAGNDDEQRRAMYIQAVSVRLAYEALLASFGPAATTKEFRALWPEAQRTFFIRFCLLSCDADQKPKPLSPRAGCLLPLHAMPEFADAFGINGMEVQKQLFLKFWKDPQYSARSTKVLFVGRFISELWSFAVWKAKTPERGGMRVMHQAYWNCHRYMSNQRKAPSFEVALKSAQRQLNSTQVRGARSADFRRQRSPGAQAILFPGRSLLPKLITADYREHLKKALRCVLKDEISTVATVDVAFDADVGGTSNTDQEEHEVAATLQDLLDALFPNVVVADWVHVFNDVLNSGYKPARSTDIAFVTGAPFFKKAFHNLADARGVATTALYVPTYLDAEVLTLEMSRERLLPHPEENAHFCVALAESCLTHSGPLIVAKLMDVKGSGHFLQAMYQEIAQIVHDARDLLTWLPDATQRKSASKVEMASTLMVPEDVMASAQAWSTYLFVSN
ncbi:hypothetical protein HPB50_005651 [Hyalomma asiaticum]|uniref:Uncharacterized protein n=1 Tax=Hyalomma asiaticum TaxID=266040 RepID=A0ACB7RM35_HYAAI|nr:hypothetical protein HPB50_005651 [Hyalomma asiaticum]